MWEKTEPVASVSWQAPSSLTFGARGEQFSLLFANHPVEGQLGRVSCLPCKGSTLRSWLQCQGAKEVEIHTKFISPLPWGVPDSLPTQP